MAMNRSHKSWCLVCKRILSEVNVDLSGFLLFVKWCCCLRCLVLEICVGHPIEAHCVSDFGFEWEI